MKTPTRQADRHVEAVLAALNVLECFLVKPSLTTIEIMQATGFTRNRVVRLTGTLVHKGFMIVDSQSGVFRIGPKLYTLGKVFERNQDILLMVRPLLKQISQKTRESTSFYVRDGLERVVLAREEGTHAIRHTIAEGQRMDLHAGAAGKVILAFSSPELVETVLAKTGLPRHTSTTITSKDKLIEELERVRVRGYAISFGEREADAVSIAVPVFDKRNELVGALALAGPVSRFTPEISQSLTQVLLSAAMKLCREMGLTGDEKKIGGETMRRTKRRI